MPEQLLNDLLRRSLKVAQGNNGFIFRVESLDHAELELLQVPDDNLQFPLALKLLNTHCTTPCEHEYEMQERAYQILAQKDDAGSVPRPFLYDRIELTQETLDVLGNKGVANVPAAADVIIMEYVNGKDLAHLLFREVAKTHPKAAPLLGCSDLESFEQSQSLAASLLGFATPGGRHRSEADNQLEARRIQMENAGKLCKYFARRSLFVNPQVLPQVGLAFRYLHREKLVHRDAHERNIMIEGDAVFDASGNGEVKTYIIDFATARSFDGVRYGPHLFSEEVLGETRTRPSDDAILGVLASLSGKANRM